MVLFHNKLHKYTIKLLLLLSLLLLLLLVLLLAGRKTTSKYLEIAYFAYFGSLPNEPTESPARVLRIWAVFALVYGIIFGFFVLKRLKPVFFLLEIFLPDY